MLGIINIDTNPPTFAWEEPSQWPYNETMELGKGTIFTAGADGPLFMRRSLNKATRQIEALGRFFGTNAYAGPESRVSVGATGKTFGVFPNLHIGAYHAYTATSGVPRTGTVAGFREVTLTSGVCLFAGKLRIATDAGVDITSTTLAGRNFTSTFGRIRRIEADPELSFYEYGSVLRLSQLMAIVEAQLLEATTVRIMLDIPRVQYYLYLLHHYEQGQLSPELYLHWMDLVDTRSDTVFEHFQWRLHSFGVRNDISRTPSLDRLADILRQRVKQSATVSLEMLCGYLGQDTLWSILLDRVPPRTIEDLVHMSYAAEVVRSTGEGRLGVGIENYTELQIKYNAEQSARLAGLPFHAFGLYPLEHFFSRRTCGPRLLPLLINDPGRFVYQNGQMKDVFELAFDSLVFSGREVTRGSGGGGPTPQAARVGQARSWVKTK